MSTPAFIAAPTPAGPRGKTCHFDGYPTHMAPALLRLVAAHGLTQVQDTFTGVGPCWSSISPGRTEHDGGTGERLVTGWGVDHIGTEQPAIPQPGFVAWSYLLDPTGLIVTENLGGHHQHRGTLPWATDPDDTAAMVAIECGLDLAHCPHAAHHHGFTDAPTGMDTATWLGHRPLHRASDLAVLHTAHGDTPAIGMTRGSATRPVHYRATTPYWWAHTPTGAPVRVGRVRRRRTGDIMVLDIEATYPATAVAPARRMPVGSVLVA